MVCMWSHLLLVPTDYLTFLPFGVLKSFPGPSSVTFPKPWGEGYNIDITCRACILCNQYFLYLEQLWVSKLITIYLEKKLCS